MCGSTYLQPSIGPRRLTAMARSQTSTSMVWMSRSRGMMPVSAALLCRQSTRPKCSTVAATIALTELSSDTSQVMAMAWPPPASISRPVSSADEPLTSTTTTSAPSDDRRRAVVRPIPEPAPVTIATLPSSSPIGRSFLRFHWNRVELYHQREHCLGTPIGPGVCGPLLNDNVAGPDNGLGTVFHQKRQLAGDHELVVQGRCFVHDWDGPVGIRLHLTKANHCS